MKFFKKQIGDAGEDLATDYLKENGFKILDRNLSCPYGEIDLVAAKKDHLYFVEIRRRTNKKYGSALESITFAKQNKIRKSAQYFLNKNKDWQEKIPFFSVLAIDDVEGFPKIEFLPDAFGY